MTKSIGNGALSMGFLLFSLLIFSHSCECQMNSIPPSGSNSTASPRVFPEAPVVVNDESLDGALRIYSPFVMDCWRLGCRPCQLMESKIDQMAADYKGEIAFGKLCTDYNPFTVRDYAVTRTPTILIFNNSTLVYKHVGNSPKEELENIILTALQMLPKTQSN